MDGFSKLEREIRSGFVARIMTFVMCASFLASLPSVQAADGDDPGGAGAGAEAASEAVSGRSNEPVIDPKKIPRSRLTRDESEAKSDYRPLVLNKGEDKIVDLDETFEFTKAAEELLANNQIVIGNPAVVALVPVDLRRRKKVDQIVFKPLSKGETNVIFRNKAGEVRIIFRVSVIESSLDAKLLELRELLRDIDGISVRIVGQKIVVDGEVIVPNDYGRIAVVLGGDKSPYADVLNLVTLSGVTLQLLSRKIQEEISVFAPNVKTRVVNGMIFLEGAVDSAEQKTRAEQVAKIYLPEDRPAPLIKRSPDMLVSIEPRTLIQNFIAVNPPPQKKQEKLVRVTVHFVELAKDYNKLFGFKWIPGFTASPSITIGQDATGSTDAASASFSATLSNLLPKLQSAQSAGFARVLKTGTVITRSGQPATLVENTSYPFPKLNGQQVTFDSAQVGLEVNVTPTILGQSEDIQMDLDLNQVNLVGRAPAAGGPPVTAQHRVKTKIYVKNKESAAVVGVQSGEVTNQFNRDDPAAGGFQAGTDPLFSLLRSKQYSKRRSQFVIFVTPQIIENASEGTNDLKKNFRVKVE